MNRLRPPRTSGRYHVLSRLREVNEEVVRKYEGDLRSCTLLDYGCGSSPYRPLFGPVAGRYLAADLAANPSADLVVAEDGRVPLADRSVDAVLSTQVLEHVAAPDRYLAEARRVLRAEGLLILSTHGYWRYHPDPTDYWRWTRDGLARLIEQSGFRLVDGFGIMGLAASGLQLFQDGISGRLPQPARKALFWLVQWVQARLDRGSVRHADAAVWLVVARKADPGGRSAAAPGETETG